MTKYNWNKRLNDFEKRLALSSFRNYLQFAMDCNSLVLEDCFVEYHPNKNKKKKDEFVVHCVYEVD